MGNEHRRSVAINLSWGVGHTPDVSRVARKAEIRGRRPRVWERFLERGQRAPPHQPIRPTNAHAQT